MRYTPYLFGVFVLIFTSVTSAQFSRLTPTPAPRTAVVPQTMRAMPTSRQSPGQHPTASPEKVEAAVNQRITSLQQMLAKESKTLEVRLANLEKRRQVALDQEDNKTLKSIEQLESKIVQDYEQNVARLVASMSAPPNATPNAGPNAGAIPRTSKNAQPNQPASQRQTPAPKKSLRLWPF